ncbi:hypothetical protein GCM10009743_19790 [Kribbella swartbergensis]
MAPAATATATLGRTRPRAFNRSTRYPLSSLSRRTPVARPYNVPDKQMYPVSSNSGPIGDRERGRPGRADVRSPRQGAGKGKGPEKRKEARRSFGPTVDPLAANRPAVVYWPPSLFHLCPAGG